MSGVLVKWGDAFLTASDVGLFASSRAWLLASNILYFLRRLESRLSLPDAVLLMDPIAVSFIRYEDDPDEIEAFKRGLSFAGREWVFAPVSDADSRSSGGSHWSLLVLHVPTNRALHLDSSASRSNAAAAMHVAAALSALSSQPPAPVTTPAATPVQTDGYSCGVFTCIFAEFFAARLVPAPAPAAAAASSVAAAVGVAPGVAQFDPWASASASASGSASGSGSGSGSRSGQEGSWLAELAACSGPQQLAEWRRAQAADVQALLAAQHKAD